MAKLPISLPPGLPGHIAVTTKATLQQQFIHLQGQLSVVQDALDEEKGKNLRLENEVKILTDNSKIKSDAVKYAKGALWIVPLTCLVLLLVSSITVPKLNFQSTEIDLNLKLTPYAQAALIIAPIAFFATVIGLLIKGVFGSKTESKEMSASDLLKALKVGSSS